MERRVDSNALEALQTYKARNIAQVQILFKAVGNAPAMRQNTFEVTVSNRFWVVSNFLKGKLGWKAGEPLFTYINLAFAPAPDDTVANLYNAFAIDGKLIVNYSTTAAWG